MVLGAEWDSGIFTGLEIARPAVAPSKEHFPITPIPYIALAAHVSLFDLAHEPKSPVFKINSCFYSKIPYLAVPSWYSPFFQFPEYTRTLS
jgi:hypothetical protein